MAVSKKPRKAFIQFAIAALVALAAGGLAIFITITVITTINSNAEQEKQRLAEAVKKLENDNKKLTSVKTPEIHAAVDIPAGGKIKPDMLTVVEVPQDEKTPHSFSSLTQVTGQVAISKISAGEVVVPKMLFDSDKGLFGVDPGMRAVTIAVDPIGSLNGVLVPGTSVDVMVTLDTDEEQFSRTLLQNALVLDVAQKTTSDGQSVATGGVTLAVTPRQAEMLALANRYGKFHLALRGFSDKGKAKVEGADVGTLLGGFTKSTLESKLDSSWEKGLTPDPSGFLPASLNGGQPTMPAPAVYRPTRPPFVMEVYKGPESETATFEWEER